MSDIELPDLPEPDHSSAILDQAFRPYFSAEQMRAYAIADREKRAQAAHAIATEICNSVAELPDRNSPEDWPEAMLVTHDELRLIVEQALDTEASKPVQAEAPSDDADPLTPEQEEWVMDLAEKHNLGRRVPQIGALRGVAPDVFYTDASYRTHELFCFAAELLAAKQAGREPVASIYVSPNGEREFDDWGHDLPVGRNELCLATKQEAQPPTAEEMRPDFEWWWTTRGVLPPLGSREAAAAWSAWIASGGYKAPSDWKLSDAPWAWDWEQEAQPSVKQKAICATVVIGNEVVGSFAGPKCVEHAALFRNALAAQAEPAGGDKEDADWPITWEVSWGELDEDDECSPCGWRVHDRRGSRNDREWELIATGNTPAEAIRAARAAQQTGERDHG